MKIKWPQKLLLSNLLYNKKFTIPLSLILAFSLWLGIAMVQKPIRERTFTDLSASVSLEGTAAEKMNLSIFSDISSQKFSVTVSGPNAVVSELSSDDFSLSIPTTNINSADEYTIDVVVNTNISDADLKIKSVYPPNVKLNVDFTSEVEFDYDDQDSDYTVVLNNVNVNEEEGFVLGNTIIPDANKIISIKGPSKVINKITSVAAVLDVNQTISKSETFDTDILLYDNNKNVLYRFTPEGMVYDGNNNFISNPYLTLSFTSVKATQEIFKQKEVTVKPKFSNLPAGLSSTDVKYKLDNSVVTILGAPEIVDNTNEILLETINFRDVSLSNYKFNKSLIVPDGLTILEDIKSANVNIDVSKYAETTITISDIRCTGLADGLKASASKKISNVKICGPKDIIKKLKASDVYATINLEGKTTGNHKNVEVIIKSELYNTIWQIGSYSTTVNITSK